MQSAVGVVDGEHGHVVIEGAGELVVGAQLGDLAFGVVAAVDGNGRPRRRPRRVLAGLRSLSAVAGNGDEVFGQLGGVVVDEAALVVVEIVHGLQIAGDDRAGVRVRSVEDD